MEAAAATAATEAAWRRSEERKRRSEEDKWTKEGGEQAAAMDRHWTSLEDANDDANLDADEQEDVGGVGRRRKAARRGKGRPTRQGEEREKEKDGRMRHVGGKAAALGRQKRTP